jgi:hypothetical protein
MGRAIRNVGLLTNMMLLHLHAERIDALHFGSLRCGDESLCTSFLNFYFIFFYFFIFFNLLERCSRGDSDGSPA